jgi:hypothetical protein
MAGRGTRGDHLFSPQTNSQSSFAGGNRDTARGTFKSSFRVVATQPRGRGWTRRTVRRWPGGEGVVGLSGIS